MAKHVVAPAASIPPNTRKLFEVAGRSIGIFNVGGAFYALRNRCPHQGAALCEGPTGSFISSSGPGNYVLSRPGEMLRCPWHGWEFDLRTGQSLFDPQGVRVKRYEVEVVPGENLDRPAPGLEKGPFVAEHYPVTIEEDYLVVEI